MDPVDIILWALAVVCVCLAVLGIGTVYYAIKGAHETKPETTDSNLFHGP